MNKSYRLIWNEVTSLWVAVAETTRGRGKRTTGAVLRATRRLALGLCAAPALAAPPLPPALPPTPTQLPTGGQVVAGIASITTTNSQSAAALTVTQSSNRAALDWATFNVGQQAKVQFNQPSTSSVTLNRVLDANPSQIFGQISANGQVFLSNPNGVYFAPGSSVDVGGLVATTHSISNADFMAGGNTFSRNGASGSVVNAGLLHAALGGYIALLAPEVRNSGVIVAQLGTVALAAGEAYQLQFEGDCLANVTVSPATIAALVDNQQAVQAPGGLIILSAQAANQLQGSVVKNSGTLEATGLAMRNGRIVLEAGAGGAVEVSGNLNASNANGPGGAIEITGTAIALKAGALLDASGSTAGGSVLVGGDWQGSGSLQQATQVSMEAGARIDASAAAGAGGKVVLWSDVHNASGSTVVRGTIAAQGGGSGAGGQIETSGHVLDVEGSAVNAGAGGLWLLDPYNVTITAAADAGGSGVTTGAGGTWTPSASGSNISNSTINAALNNGQNVTITTTGAGADVGDITTTAPITKTSGGASTLTLKANRRARAGAISSTVGALNVVLWSDSDGTHDGGVEIGGAISTNGGQFWAGGGSASTTWNGLTVPNGPSEGNSSANNNAMDVLGSVATQGGNVMLWSGTGVNSVMSVASSNFAVNAGSGSVTFKARGFNLNGLAAPAVTTTGAFSVLPDVTGGSFGQTVQTSFFNLSGAAPSAINYGATGNTSALTLDSNLYSGGATLTGDTINVAVTSMALSIYASLNLNGKVVLKNDFLFTSIGCCYPLRYLNITGSLDSDADATPRSLTTGDQVQFNMVGDIGSVHRLGAFTSTGLIPTLTGDLRTSGAITISTNRSKNLTYLGVNGTPLQLTKTGTTLIDSNNFDINLYGITASGTGTRDLTINAGTGSVTLGNATEATVAALPGNMAVSGSNITVTGAITKTDAANSSITLTASNSLAISANITATGTGQLATTLNATGGAVSDTGNLNTNGGLLTVNSATAGTLSGVVSGAGALTKTGAGTTTLTGANTYGGSTTISAGRLQVGNGGTIGTLGTGAIVDNAALVYNRSDALTVAGAISGSGTLTQAGTGTTTLTGANTYSGTTTISAGTLQVGNGGSTGSLGTGSVVDNANLVYNLAANTTLSAGNSITGTGNLSTTITGTLTTNNSITLGGTVNLQATGDITQGAAITSAGAETINATGGNVFINASDTVTTAGAALLVKAAGDITQAASTTAQTNGGAITYNANTSGTGGAIMVKTGASVRSQGGHIALGGGVAGDGSGSAVGSTSTNKVGVDLTSATLNAAGGNVTVRGQGYAGTGIAQNGVNQTGGTISTTGAGAVTVVGTGGAGTGASSNNMGVQVAGTVTGGSTGSTTVTGTGGAAPGSDNYGVFVTGAGSAITSTGGAVTVSGTAGGTGSSPSNIGVAISIGTVSSGGSGNVSVTGTGGDAGGTGGLNHGVWVLNAGTITAGGTGTVTVQGTGGASSGSNNSGVRASSANSKITSAGGAVSVSGTGGGIGASGSNYGVHLFSSAQISSGGNGNVGVTALGGTGSGGKNAGLVLQTAGLVTAAGTGTVSVQGTGGTSTVNTNDNSGVLIEGASSQIGSSGGAVTVTAQGGTGAGIGNPGVYVNTSGAIRTTGNAPITITTDSYVGDGTEIVNAGTGTVTIRNRSAGTLVNLGGADVLTGSPLTLGLTDAELDRITAGSLVVGRNDATASGNVTVSSAVSPAAATNLTVLTGGNVAVNAGLTSISQLTVIAGNGAAVNTDITVGAAISAGGATTLNSTAGSVNLNANTTVTGAAAPLLVKAGVDILQAASVAVQTNGGAITYNANGSGTGGAIELATSASISSQGGNIALGGGVAGDASGVALARSGHAVGINLTAASVNAGAGNISLRGQGATWATLSNHGIKLQTGSSLTTAGAGSISLTGTGGAGNGALNNGYNYGVHLVDANSQVNATGSGAVNITGTGGGTGPSLAGIGVEVEGGAKVLSATGSITVTGTGAANSGNNNFGVQLNNTNSAISSSAGNVTVSGTGGASAASASGYGYGVYLVNGAQISAAGSGTVTVQGQGAAGSTGFVGVGVVLESGGGISTSGAGNLSITGSGGSGTNSNIGVQVSGSGRMEATGTGSVTITGTAGAGAANGNYGVYVGGSGSRLGSAGGGISVTGTGNGSGAASYNHGVAVDVGSTIDATGSGNVVVVGTGGGSANGTFNEGVLVNGAGSKIASAGGTVSVTGTGGGQAGGTGNSNIGVWATASGVISAGNTGALTVTGTGGYGSGGGNRGVFVQNASLQAGVGPAPSGASGSVQVTAQARDGLSLATEMTSGQISTVNAPITLSNDSLGVDASSSIYAGTATATVANRAAGTAIDLGGADVLGGTLKLGISDAELDRITAGSVVIGRKDAAALGAMTVSSAITPALTTQLSLLSGAAIAVNNAVTVADTLTLTGGAGTTVSGSGLITTPKLLLNGSGASYALNTVNEAVGTLATNNINALAFSNTGSLAIGSVGGVNGISAAGNVVVQTTGTLTVGATQGITTGSGISVVAGRFVNNNASSSTFISGATGWQVWSSNSSPFGGATPDVRGGLSSYNFKQYNATYGVTTPSGTGNGYLYTLAPTVSLTLSGSTSKIFDGSTTASATGLTLSNTGTVDGDTFSNGFGTSTFDTRNVGTGKTVTVGSLTGTASNGSASVYGYTFASTVSAALGSITAKVLNLSGSKTYDGGLSVAATSLALGGLVGTETLALSGSGSTLGKNVGTGLALSLGSLAIANGTNGGLASNYTLAGGSDKVDINKKGITVSGITASNKTYDGNANATVVSSGAVFTGLLSGETASVATSTGVFADKNVGTSKTVTLTSTYSGADLANYTVTDQASTTASITAKVLDLSGSKAYDAGTSVAATKLALGGLVGTETLTLTGSGSTVDKNVGTDIAVSLGSLAIGNGANGGLASNYTLAGGSDKVTVTKIGVTVSGIKAADKTYDGGTSATVDRTGVVFGGLLSGDTASVVDSTGVFADKNVANNKTVTLTNTFSTGDLANYNVINQASTTATITAKVLNLSGSKTYDAGTGVAYTALTLGGLVGAETLTLSGSGSTLDKKAGIDKPLTLGTLALVNGTNGGLASNYTLSGGSDKVTIDKAGITVSGITASNKTYDGSTSATVVSTGAMFNGLLSGDVVSVANSTGVFADKNVATSKTVTLTTTYGGGDVANYTVTNQASTTANITAKVLDLSGSKTYDAGTSVAYTALTLGGLVGSETLALSGSGSTDDKNAGTDKPLALGTLALSNSANGDLASNYTLAGGIDKVTINKAGITLSGIAAVNKTYDGNTSATVDSTGAKLLGLINGDVVSVASSSGTFANKNAGTGKTVTLTNTFGGADAGNYTVTNQTTTLADIAPKTLNLSGSKVYDASTTVLASSLTLSGLVGTEAIALSGSGSTVDKNVGTDKVVSLGSLALANGSSGDLASNYTLASGRDKVTIDKAGITVSGITASNRAYDGSTTATVSTTSAKLNGLISGDGVSLTSTGAFDTKNAGIAKTVALTNTFDGADLANYTVTDQVSTTANITPKVLTASGLTATSKTYDGTTSVAISNWGDVATGVGSELLTLNHGSAAFDTANVGVGKTVSATGYSLADAGSGATTGLASNYTLSSSSASTSANISKAALQVTANNDAKFVTQGDAVGYDGVSYSGFVNGETSAVLTGSASIARSNSGTEVAGVYSGVLVASGLGSGNYAISYAPGSYTIVPSNQLKVKVTSASTTYGTQASFGITSAQYFNGSSVVNLAGITANGSNNFTVSDGVGGSATFTVTPVAPSTSTSGKLTVGAYQLGVGGVSTLNNANFNNTVTLVGSQSVTAKGVTANASGGVSKVYDGNTAMAGVTINLTGEIANDVLTVSGNGAFTQKNAGTNLGYTVDNLALGGADSGNYVLTGGTSFAGSNGAIATKKLDLSGSKQYDAGTGVAATSLKLGGLVGTETLTLSGSGSTGDKNVGAAKDLSLGTLALSNGSSGDLASNYTLVGGNDTVDITKAGITVSGITAANKAYDGGTSATVNKANALLKGLIAGDAVNVATSSGSFADKDAANGKTVTLTTTYGGTDLGNYTVTNQASATANITPKVLDLSGSKVYDAGLGVAASKLSLSGLVGTETLVLSGSGSTANKKVEASKALSLGTLAVADGSNGGVASNYTLAGGSDTVDITQADLKVRGITAANKVYDGSTSATTNTSGVMLVGLIGGDSVSVTSTGSFGDPNAANGKTVALSNTYTGTDLGNYAVTEQASTTADITAKVLGLSGSKTYDRSTSVDATVLNLTGLVGSETLSLSGTGSTTTKSVATSKPLALGTLALADGSSGDLASNYTLVGGSDTVDIKRADITLSGITAANKVYDGNTNAVINSTGASLRGLISGDMVSVSSSGTFADKNAATGKTVTLTNTFGGADLANYNVTSQSGTTANITPRALTMVGTSATNKVYDATTSAQVLPGTLTGLVGTETLLASVNFAQFNNAHAGNNKTVTVAFALANGSGLATNYSIADATTSASINTRPVNLVADAQAKSQGQSDPLLTYRAEAPTTLRGLVAGERLAGSLSRAPGEALGSYAIAQGTVTNSNNPDYAIAFVGADLVIGLDRPAPIRPPVPPVPPPPSPPTRPTPQPLPEPEPGPTPEAASGPDPGLEPPSEPGSSTGTDGTEGGTVFQENRVPTGTLLTETAMLSESGVMVTLVQNAEPDVNGFVVVQVARQLIAAGKNLDFPLPAALANNVTPDNQLRISTLDGQDMPSWLSYESDARRFVASQVPPGALPLYLVLELKGLRWMVLVTDGAS